MSQSSRRIWAFYRLIDSRRLLLVLVGGCLVSAPMLVGLVAPLIIRQMIDTLSTQKILDTATLGLLAGFYAGAFVASLLGEALYNRNKYLAAEEMRHKIFVSAPYFPIKQLREKGSAYYAQLIADQVNQAFVLLDYGMIRNIFYLLRMVGVLGLVFALDRAIFVLFLLNVGFVLSYARLVDRAIRPHFSRLLELARVINAYVVETFENLREIWAGEGLAERQAGHRRRLREITHHGVSGEMARARLDVLLVDIPTTASQLLVLAYVGYQVVAGQATIGTLWAFWAYLGMVTAPVYVMRDLSRVAVQSSATIDNVLQFFDEARHYERRYSGASLEPGHADVYRLTGLSKAFGPRHVLDGVSFTLHRGDVLGIVGLSGEGKSVLLDILLGFDREFDGDVRLLNADITRVSQATIFERVGYYSQDIGILNATLEDNVIMGMPRDEMRLRATIDSLRLGHLRDRLLGEGGSFISGGEKHRVALARLLYADKPVFVVDEPLANLDAISERLLLEQLAQALSVRSGIIISHRPEILHLAKTLVVLSDGHVAATGPAVDVMERSALYRELISSYLENADVVSRMAGRQPAQ